jgi:hypothetical protein
MSLLQQPACQIGMQMVHAFGSHGGGGPASTVGEATHLPPLHVRPVDEQSMHVAAPVPQVVVDCPPVHCPASLQQPPQFPTLHFGTTGASSLESTSGAEASESPASAPE